jgi:hypothetical protein
VPRDDGGHLRLNVRDLGAITCLVMVAAGLYLPRLLPSTGYSPDTMKYHYIGAVLGISHPPGSPLYILINWAVSQLPIGELAWRLNLMSALAAAVSAAALYLVCRDLSSRLPAFVASLALLAAALFWEQSLVAEVYTLHAVFLLGSVWRLLRWYRTGVASDLGWAALLFGLSFGIHLMSWYLLPGWVALVLIGPRSIIGRRREVLLVALGALAGMSTYLYYAIRPAMQPLYVEVQIDSVGAFFDYITGGYFKGRMFAYDMRAMATERLSWLAAILRTNIGVPLLTASLAGLAVVFVQSVRLGILLAAPILLGSLYAMGYAVGDARIFALPAVYMLLVSAACGLDALFRWIGRVAPSRSVASAAALAVALLIAAERADDVARDSVILDRSGDYRYAVYAERILTDVERGSTIVAGTDWIFHALAYQHWGRGLRANGRLYLQPADEHDCAETRRSVELYLARGPVYGTTGLTACLESDYALDAHDLSRTLSGYLAAIPENRLVLAAIQDEGTAGIDGQAWDALNRLGVLTGMRDRYRWSYAAALVRTGPGFRGVERSGPTGALLALEARSTLFEGLDLPFDLTIRSGGGLSGHDLSIVADGVEYARPDRGLQIVVFDRRTGAAVDRQVFDTHRTMSLREFGFFRIAGRKP